MGFESPKHLAVYLHYLDSHDEEYNSYLDHKLRALVNNKRLKGALEKRSYSGKDSDMLWSVYKIADGFESFLCKKAHDKVSDKISLATIKHHSCEIPMSILSRQLNFTNQWVNMWFQGWCEAQVIRNFVDSGVINFTIVEYNNAVNEMVKTDKCVYSEENAKDLYLEQSKT